MINLLIGLSLLAFPFISQETDTAPYLNDCHSASVLMVARYYGLGEDQTVAEVQEEMVGKDKRAKYPDVVSYLEDKYNLETKVVTTYKPIKDMLVRMELEGAQDIEIVDDIPHDKPVIWIYVKTPHWVVRFNDFNYDPANGVFPFDQTSEKMNLYRPDLGLGIIVTPKEVETPTAKPSHILVTPYNIQPVRIK